MCVGLQLHAPQLGDGPAIGGGGYIGAWSLAWLEPYFTTQGITIIAATTVAAGILIAGELFLLQFLIAIPLLPFRLLGALFRRRPAAEDSETDPDPDETDGPEETDEADESDEVDEPAPTKASKAGALARSKPASADQGESAGHCQVDARPGPRTARSRQFVGAKRTLRAAVARPARAGRRFSLRDPGREGPGGGRRPGKDLQGLQPERAGRRDRHGAGHHPVRARAGSRPAAVESRRAGRRSGDRAARADRPHRPVDSGQEHGRRRSAE